LQEGTVGLYSFGAIAKEVARRMNGTCPRAPCPTRFLPALEAWKDLLRSSSFQVEGRLPDGCVCGVPGCAVVDPCVPSCLASRSSRVASRAAGCTSRSRVKIPARKRLSSAAHAASRRRGRVGHARRQKKALRLIVNVVSTQVCELTKYWNAFSARDACCSTAQIARLSSALLKIIEGTWPLRRDRLRSRDGTARFLR